MGCRCMVRVINIDFCYVFVLVLVFCGCINLCVGGGWGVFLRGGGGYLE